jgi:hypothetical protein
VFHEKNERSQNKKHGPSLWPKLLMQEFFFSSGEFCIFKRNIKVSDISEKKY